MAAHWFGVVLALHCHDTCPHIRWGLLFSCLPHSTISLPFMDLPSVQVHGLEQEVALAVQTSQHLQRQRANLVATLDILRTMDGVAQVLLATSFVC